MPSRHRNYLQTQHYSAVNNGLVTYLDERSVPLWVMHESAFPGPCNVVHEKYALHTGKWFRSVDPSSNFRNYIGVPRSPSGLVNLKKQVQEAISSLNWGKLPSSTEAGIIQILAEIDDTISIFTVKFWKQLSYGSFTWGVMPFVSELLAVSKAVRNLSLDLEHFLYEDELTVEVSDEYLSGRTYTSAIGNCKVRKTGHADISFQHNLSILFDRVGFHPDLATAWDLVPASFLVDYLLPIGDYLQSFRQGGWVKAAIFKGWITAKYSLDLTFHGREDTFEPLDIGIGKYTRFERWHDQNQVLYYNEKSPDFELKIPSLREMFNILYVKTSLGKRF